MVVTFDSVSDGLELYSSQEEADTRIIIMILHAVSNARDFTRIVVRADDTDILVLLVY